MAMPTYVLYSTPTPISFSQLQAEFGGSSPISLSEYYRGGQPLSQSTARVPSFNQAWIAQYVASSFSSTYRITQTSSGPNGVSQIWTFAGVNIFNGAGNNTSLNAASNSTDFSYKRGALNSSVTTPANSKTGAAAFTTSFYVIERNQYVLNTFSDRNTTVPQRGYSQTPPTISMSNFYNTQDYPVAVRPT